MAGTREVRNRPQAWIESSRLDRLVRRMLRSGMNLEQIKLRLHGGFRPFVLHLSDGRKFKIGHPEFILIGKGVVAILRKDGLIETVDALHVVSVEDVTSASSRA